ncbi:MAG TPA: 50S ribosomal protein L29 [archaeon]|nr:50S ribosomal protein L29 [archaeon]
MKELKGLKPEDMDKRLSDSKMDLIKERGNVKMRRPIKNPGRIRELRRTVARILTIKGASKD